MVIFPFTMEIPILSTVFIFGFNLKNWVFYSFVLVYFVYRLLFLSATKTVLSKRFYSVGLFIIVSVCASFFVDVTNMTKLGEAILFFAPIALCGLAENSEASAKKCIDVLLLVNIFSGILSALIAIGVVEVDYGTTPGELVRTAGAINSTLGVGGFIAGVCRLFIESDTEDKTRSTGIINILGFVGSAVAVLFSLSRTRIVIVAFVCLAIFVYNLLFIGGSQKNSFKMLLLMVVAVVFFIMWFPDVFNQLFDTIIGRYQVSDDVNIDVRVVESNLQLDYFKQNPFIGMGWGYINYLEKYGIAMSIHNTYTSLLMYTGIVGFVAYFSWYISYLPTLIKGLKISAYRSEVFTAVLFWFSLTVLGFTNSGLTQYGAYFMMFYIALVVRDISKCSFQNSSIKIDERKTI